MTLAVHPSRPSALYPRPCAAISARGLPAPQVQPAFFHPAWSFEGLDADSPIHFEKRAPYPVINLLRRQQLDSVVEAGLSRGVVVNKQIAEHNAAALEREGYRALESWFRGVHEGKPAP